MKLKNSRIRIFFLIALFSFFAISCRQTESRVPEPYFEWVDSYGREVILEKEPQRIVSLSPGITEMIFMLQSEDKLVGITDFCNFPESTGNITKVGGLINFSIEYILSLEPDVVLIGSIVQKEDVEKMESVGLPVIAIREENRIEGIYDALEVLGQIVNKEELAARQIDLLKTKVAEIELPDQPKQERRSVYYVVGFGDGGDYTAPRNSHIHEIITLAGGRNIGEDLTGWNVSREYLFDQDPHIIVIRKEDKDKFCSTHPYTQLNAVKNERVYPIESGWIDIISPRNIHAVEFINAAITEE